MINALRNVGSGLNLIQQTLTSHKEKVKVVSALLAAVCADFYMISIVYLFMSIYRSVLSLSNLGSLIYREIHMFVWHHNLYVDKAESGGFGNLKYFDSCFLVWIATVWR